MPLTQQSPKLRSLRARHPSSLINFQNDSRVPSSRNPLLRLRLSAWNVTTSSLPVTSTTPPTAPHTQSLFPPAQSRPLALFPASFRLLFGLLRNASRPLGKK